MNNLEYDAWRELEWRRKLKSDEEARLLADLQQSPKVRAELEEEARLTELLGQLPDAFLSSNFTAQVLQAVEGNRQGKRGLPWPFAQVRFGSLRSALGPVAVVTALALGCLSYYEYQGHARAELAHSIVTVSSVATLPSLEALKDFEPINRMSQVPPIVDVDLLAALQ